MADVDATFRYDADFSSAISETQRLTREVSLLNAQFNAFDRTAATVKRDFADAFRGGIGEFAGLRVEAVNLSHGIEDFGKALDKSKLKLRDYAREARVAFRENSNARKLAEDQVRRTKAQLVELGMDPSGNRRGMLVTPMTLDMSDMQTKLEVSRKQFDIFNKLVQDGSTHLINWGKNTQWAGRQLTVGLTVPMTIFASTTVKAFNEVDAELTRFQKVYGSTLVQQTAAATAAIRGQVQAVAVDIAKTYGIAAKETAGLSADLAATGLEGQKLIESIKQTTRLGVLGELDRQTAMKTTLSLQNAFNMSTQELANSIDFLNAVENQTSVSLADLSEAIPKVGPVVRALGGDVKDLSVLLVAMKEGGINAAEGANALKSGLASLINPTKNASEVAKQYGIDLEAIVSKNKGKLLPTVIEFQQSLQTLDELGKAKVIEQIFGKYQFARISALFDNLNQQGSQTRQVIQLMGKDSKELARIASQELETLTGSTSMRFKRSLEGIKASLLPLGEAIAKSVIPFMDKMSTLLDKIINFGQSLPGPVKSFLKFAAGLTAIAGPIIMITGVLGNFLGYIIKGAMAFVNLGRKMAGLPTEQFTMLSADQIAAAKATDQLIVSIDRQKQAMIGLNDVLMQYSASLRRAMVEQEALFVRDPLDPSSIPPGGTPIKPSRRGRGGTPPVRRMFGGGIYRAAGGEDSSSWVPGVGEGDKVKALLEPGEFVINKKAAKKHKKTLEAINSGTPRMQSGGEIDFSIDAPLRAMSGKPIRNRFAEQEDRILAAAQKRREDRQRRMPASGVGRFARVETEFRGSQRQDSHIVDQQLMMAMARRRGFNLPVGTEQIITPGFVGQAASLSGPVNSAISIMQSSTTIPWSTGERRLIRRGYPIDASEARQFLQMIGKLEANGSNATALPEAKKMLQSIANGKEDPVRQIVEGLALKGTPSRVLDQIKANPRQMQHILINYMLDSAQSGAMQLYALPRGSSTRFASAADWATSPFAGLKQGIGRRESMHMQRAQDLGFLLQSGGPIRAVLGQSMPDLTGSRYGKFISSRLHGGFRTAQHIDLLRASASLIYADNPTALQKRLDLIATKAKESSKIDRQNKKLGPNDQIENKALDWLKDPFLSQAKDEKGNRKTLLHRSHAVPSISDFEGKTVSGERYHPGVIILQSKDINSRFDGGRVSAQEILDDFDRRISTKIHPLSPIRAVQDKTSLNGDVKGAYENLVARLRIKANSDSPLFSKGEWERFAWDAIRTHLGDLGEALYRHGEIRIAGETRSQAGRLHILTPEEYLRENPQTLSIPKPGPRPGGYRPFKPSSSRIVYSTSSRPRPRQSGGIIRAQSGYTPAELQAALQAWIMPQAGGGLAPFNNPYANVVRPMGEKYPGFFRDIFMQEGAKGFGAQELIRAETWHKQSLAGRRTTGNALAAAQAIDLGRAMPPFSSGTPPYLDLSRFTSFSDLLDTRMLKENYMSVFKTKGMQQRSIDANARKLNSRQIIPYLIHIMTSGQSKVQGLNINKLFKGKSRYGNEGEFVLSPKQRLPITGLGMDIATRLPMIHSIEPGSSRVIGGRRVPVRQKGGILRAVRGWTGVPRRTFTQEELQRITGLTRGQLSPTGALIDPNARYRGSSNPVFLGKFENPWGLPEVFRKEMIGRHTSFDAAGNMIEISNMQAALIGQGTEALFSNLARLGFEANPRTMLYAPRMSLQKDPMAQSGVSLVSEPLNVPDLTESIRLRKENPGKVTRGMATSIILGNPDTHFGNILMAPFTTRSSGQFKDLAVPAQVDWGFSMFTDPYGGTKGASQWSQSTHFYKHTLKEDTYALGQKQMESHASTVVDTMANRQMVEKAFKMMSPTLAGDFYTSLNQYLRSTKSLNRGEDAVDYIVRMMKYKASDLVRMQSGGPIRAMAGKVGRRLSVAQNQQLSYEYQTIIEKLAKEGVNPDLLNVTSPFGFMQPGATRWYSHVSPTSGVLHGGLGTSGRFFGEQKLVSLYATQEATHAAIPLIMSAIVNARAAGHRIKPSSDLSSYSVPLVNRLYDIMGHSGPRATQTNNIGFVDAGGSILGTFAENLRKSTNGQYARLGIPTTMLNQEHFNLLGQSFRNMVKSRQIPTQDEAINILKQISPEYTAALLREEELFKRTRRYSDQADVPEFITLQSGGILRAMAGKAGRAAKKPVLPPEHWSNNMQQSLASTYRLNFIESLVDQGLTRAQAERYADAFIERLKYIPGSESNDINRARVRGGIEDELLAKIGNPSEIRQSIEANLAAQKTRGALGGQYGIYKNKKWVRNATVVDWENTIIEAVMSRGYSRAEAEIYAKNYLEGSWMYDTTNMNVRRLRKGELELVPDYFDPEYGKKRAMEIAKRRREGYYKSGGIIRAQTGIGSSETEKWGNAWVPGSGEGDKIRALLEPGEFVVNKVAAAKHGGMLNYLNYVDSPRFQSGGLAGVKNNITIRAQEGYVSINPNDINPFTGQPDIPEGYELTGLTDEKGNPMAKPIPKPAPRPKPRNRRERREQRKADRQSGINPGGMSPAMKFSTAMGSVGMLAMSLPAVAPANESLAKLSEKAMMAAFALSAISGLAGLGKGGVGKGVVKGLGKIGTPILKTVGTAGARAGVTAAASTAGGGLLGLGVTGAAVATGAAILAPLVAIGVAWKVIYDRIQKAKKAQKEAFTVGAQTASAYGIAITNVSDKIKENQDLADKLKVTNSSSTTVSVGTSQEKIDAIKEDNKSLIGQIKASEGKQQTSSTKGPNGNPIIQDSADAIKQKNLLITKFATLRQQGFSQQDAMEVVTQIAKEAGSNAQMQLQSIRPELERMAGDNLTKVFKTSQEAQLSALKNTEITGDSGSSEGFREAFKGAMDAIQYAAPQDQIEALNKLIENMSQFDASQIIQAGKALSEAAAAEYGKKSNVTKTIDALTATGDAKDLENATRLESAIRGGLDSAIVTNITADNQLSPDEMKIINSFLDEKDQKAQLVVDIQTNADKEITKLEEYISKEQKIAEDRIAYLDNQERIENNRYETAQKRHQDFIKEKQKEIDVINKGTDAYLEGLQKQNEAENFYRDQSKTALGGLGALAGGDVFGFVQAQQQMAAGAQQFGFEQQISNIEAQRQAAVDAKQAEIDKEQELADTEDERHEKRMKYLQNQRDEITKTTNAHIKGAQAAIDAYDSLASQSGDAFDALTDGYSQVAIDANGLAAAQAAVNYLATHPDATVEQAIAEGRKIMGTTVPGGRTTSGSENSGSAGTTTTVPRSSSNTSGSENSGSSGYSIPTTSSTAVLPSGKTTASGGYESGLESSIPQGGRLDENKLVTSSGDESVYEKLRRQIFLQPYPEIGSKDKYPSGRPHRSRYEHPVDYLAGSGTPVKAIFDGIVNLKDYGSKSYGKHIILNGAENNTAIYGHLSKYSKDIMNNGEVKAGQIIGYTGNTGNSTGPHLHFEWSRFGSKTIGSLLRGLFNKKSTPTIPEDNVGLIEEAFGVASGSVDRLRNGASLADVLGIGSFIGGRRQIGGSMTMNTPYLVGEGGPEVVMPYGFGTRVVPIKYTVPKIAQGGIIGESSSTSNITISVNGVHDPNKAAERAVQLLEQRARRRDFSGSIS